MTKASQLKTGVIISYVTTAVIVLTNLIYTPLLTSLLGQSEYGLYTVVASVVNYLSLFSLGFGASYLRYFSRYQAEGCRDKVDKLNGIFLIVFLVLAACACVAGIFLTKNIRIVLGDKISEAELRTAKTLMLVLVINIVMTFPSSVFDSIIVAHECYIFQRSINLISKLANPLLVVPLLLMGYKSVAVVFVTTFLTFVNLLINMFYCFVRLKVKFVFCDLNFKILSDMGRFSFFVFINMIIDQINWSVDKFLLIRFSGTAAVAVYGIASQINALYLNFSTQISSVFLPRVNQIVAENDNNMNRRLTNLFIRVGRIQNMVMLLILFGFIIFGKYFINLWVGDEYSEAYLITLLLIIPVTIPLIQNLGIEIQRAKNMHQFRSIVYLGIAVMNVLISIPLTKSLGAVGSAFGTAAALILGNCIIMNRYYHKCLGIDMIAFWKSIFSFLPAIVPDIIVGVIIVKFVVFDSLLTYLLVIAAFIFVYCFFMWKLGMNKEEKELVMTFLRRIGHENHEK